MYCVGQVITIDLLSSSNPLPPISRLEEQNQIKRCARLRRAIHRALATMFSSYYNSYLRLKPFAVKLDLEKYYDVYEISRTDMEEAQIVANANYSEIEDADTLQALKSGLRKLHIIRKLCLCTLLALNADGSKSDFHTWPAAIDALRGLSSITVKMIANIDEILGEEEGQLSRNSYWTTVADRKIRFSNTAYTQGTLDTWKRAHEKPDETTRQSVSRDSRSPGEDETAERRV